MFSNPAAPALSDPLLDRVRSQLATARAAAQAKGVTISPADEEAFIREETQGRYTRSDLLNYVAPLSDTDRAALVRSARAMLAKTAGSKSAGVDVTSDDQEAWLRRETNGRFGYDDAMRAMRETVTPPNASMDPSLINAARQLATARHNAAAAGSELSPEDQEAFMRESTRGQFGLRDASGYLSTVDANVTPRNMSRSFVQGALGNWGDELLGKLPSWLGGGASGEADMRARQEAFENTHPVAHTLATIGGAGSVGLLVPGGEAATVSGAAARGAGTGLLSGVVAGAGAGETSAERARGAAIGGVVGAGIGAVIPGAVASARAFAKPSLRASARIARAIQLSGGTDKVRQAASDVAAAGRGNEVMLGDLSDHLRNAVDFAATNDGDGSVSVPLARRVQARQADQADRLLGDVRAGIGGDADAGARRAQLEASRSQWAEGPNGYGGLRDQAGSFDLTPVAKALRQPTVQSALKQARLAGDLTADSPLDAFVQRIVAHNPGANPSDIARAAKAGLLGDDAAAASQGVRPLSFDDVHQFSRVLGDKASAAFNRGNGALGNAYGTVRDAVKDALEEGAPGFRTVNAGYASRLRLERALTAGEDAWSATDSRGLAQQVSALSPEELAELRTGMASKLIAQLRNAATNRDEAARLLNASASMDNKLRAVFGDAPTFASFMRRVGTEADLARIRSALGGSATARRLQAAGFDPGELGLSAVMHGPAGLLRGALHALQQGTTGALRRSTAREMGPMLMTQGAPNIEALLQSLTQRPPLVGRGLTTATPFVTARVPSLFDQP